MELKTKLVDLDSQSEMEVRQATKPKKTLAKSSKTSASTPKSKKKSTQLHSPKKQSVAPTNSMSIGIPDKTGRLTSDIIGSLNIEIHGLKISADNFYYLRFTCPDFEPTFMHPQRGEWNSTVVRGSGSWKRGQHTHTLLHSWIFQVPMKIKVDVMLFTDGEEVLASERAGKKKPPTVEWDVNANQHKATNQSVASFKLTIDSQEKVSVDKVWYDTNVADTKVCLSYTALFLSNYTTKEIDALQQEGSMIEPSMICRREFPDYPIAPLIYGDYCVRIQGELHDIFVLKMVSTQKWMLPVKEWYKRKMLLWRFFVPMYDANNPLAGYKQQRKALDLPDKVDPETVPLAAEQWKSVEYHRRFLRIKNLWVKIVTYLITRGYSLQPYLLLLKNSKPRKKGDAHPNLILVGSENEKYFVDMNGTLSRDMQEDLGKIETGLRQVTDFDGQILSYYMNQESFSPETYKGLNAPHRTRVGALFMNRIVSVFAKYNYEIVNSTLGFFVVVGTDKGEEKLAQPFSIIPCLDYKSRSYEPFLRLNGDVTNPEVSDLLNSMNVTSQTIPGSEKCDAFRQITIPNTDASKPGSVRETNFLLGILEVLNSFVAKGYNIHSTSIPGDIIINKTPSGVEKMFQNNYFAQRTEGTCITIGPALHEEISTQKSIVIEVVGNDFDDQAARCLRAIDWKKIKVKQYERGYKWRFYISDKIEGRKSTKAQHYFLLAINALAAEGWRVIAPFWEQVFTTDTSTPIWKQGATYGSSGFVILQKTNSKLEGTYSIINADVDKQGFYLSTRGVTEKQAWMDDLGKRSGVSKIEKQAGAAWNIRVDLASVPLPKGDLTFNYETRQHFRYKNETNQYMLQLVDMLARNGGCYLFKWGTFYDTLFFIPSGVKKQTISAFDDEEVSLSETIASFF
eukprot:TRINITY_DN1052_c1_g1_i3.p1 TRINITY_DN1052_c1_g1~~TRINITY_DN1052_c1_g1_i3.p1  ORF type:complete len:965 (-),score=188.78 TRINITY_DN1052_c1_g1_i3:121-2838(-)